MYMARLDQRSPEGDDVGDFRLDYSVRFGLPSTPYLDLTHLAYNENFLVVLEFGAQDLYDLATVF